MPLLTNNRWRSILSRSIDRAVARHRFRLVAFVSMPEHVHLLVYPSSPTSRVSLLLKAIIDYIHLNPVRRNLVTEAVRWRWSSCRRFHDVGGVDDALPTIHGLPPEN
jgi:REP element-mobilizing transposase RayT